MAEVLFKKVDYTVRKLIEDVSLGEIGLPHIQRPFVWKRKNVRDLFDSMYRGFPIGYFLFWENDYGGARYRQIGADGKQKPPRLLIVDGQQRLTSLYAVFKGVPVVNDKYRKELIRIAFHPLTEKFEVANSAIRRDLEWIPDISVLWNPDISTFGFIQEFLNRLKRRRELSPAEENKVAAAIDRVVKLQAYPVTALEISSSANDAQVAEIFVRINSKGAVLNRSDFILTLMSVFWDEGRQRLEEFCKQTKIPPEENKASPYNLHLRPDPDQLLRVSVALGFRRAQLEHVYSLLHGKDLETGQYSESQRDKQFAILKESQHQVLNVTHWHEFLKVLKRCGYVAPKLITSEMAVYYSYALWLVGKRDFQVEPHRLRDVIARWLFMSSLTGRYTGSPESRMESDLALLGTARTADDFVRVLDQQIEAVLTKDYWEITLPNELETAAARSRALLAYYAALCLLDAPVLFSKMKVSQLLDASTKSKKSALERHHLFPRGYLRKINFRDKRVTNQVANYSLVEWFDNIRLSDHPPSEYIPKLESKFAPEEIQEMYRLHALPENWYTMDYPDFLKERRKRMAQVIRTAFSQLHTPATTFLSGEISGVAPANSK